MSRKQEKPYNQSTINISIPFNFTHVHNYTLFCKSKLIILDINVHWSNIKCDLLRENVH